MGDIFSYLKARWMLWGFGLIAVGAVPFMAFLSGQDMAIASYTALVLGFILLLILIIDGAGYILRLRRLRALRTRLEALPNALPEGGDAIYKQTQELIRALAKQSAALTDALAAAHKENLAYYTLWIHQIKTPIAAMGLVLRDSAGPEADVLRQELFKVERYVELALQYIKLKDIAQDLVIERCALLPIVRESVKKYGLLFVYKGLSVEIGEMEAEIASDKKWLAFIIEQLLSNAVKYTNAGGVKVYMEGGRLVIEDSGIGIRPEDLPRIFEKGYTGFNGRVDNRASGIGLYLVKKVANALSIGIEVQSGQGEGTRIALSFPDGDDFKFQT